MQKRVQMLMTLLVFCCSSLMAQITTSGIYGHITSESEDVVGASITATHTPSGTVYRAVTNSHGRYTIQGMRVGGPYTVEVSYIGYQSQEFKNVQLLLGESQNLSCSLQEDAMLLDELVVTGQQGLNASKTGAAQSISSEMINSIPSITHSIADIVRINPLASINNQSGAMSFAGTNNRYNSFMVDGVNNNDSFGLTMSGQNGGQAGTQPLSMATVDQIQINIAPFDVRQGGFTGGAINATTKSGTNQFHGSVYGFGNNEDLVGRHYLNPDGSYASPYHDEKEYLAGITLGGPIIKNKLFFFANFEKSNKEYPNSAPYGSANQKIPTEYADNVLNAVKDMAAQQGYDYTGAYSTSDIYQRNTKYGLKLDWNINDFNKLTFRYSHVDAEQLKGLGGTATLATSDHEYEFQHRTNTFMLELHSRISPSLSNEARLSFAGVRDRRAPGAAFPQVTIYNVGTGDNKGTINIGNEYSSMANSLDQDTWTFEDNFTWYKGNHTITFGTHNEMYQFRNLFIQNLYGCYYFANYNDFMSYYQGFLNGTPDGTKIQNYYFSQANVDVTGDPRWAAEFKAAQLGFYAQDKWDITDSFQLTYGLRMDMPMLFDKPSENAGFNEYAAAQGWNFKTNQKFKVTPLWSPRVGFRWDINKDRKYILRGGAGVFTGRTPFVWLSNNFSNTGIQLSSYSTAGTANLQLLLDPNSQTINAENLRASGSQTINVFDKKFKFAQTARFNLGFDFEALGINWTAEAIYSKVMNDVYYKNLAYEATGRTFNQEFPNMPWDVRPMMTRKTTGTPYNNIYALYNTSKGYSYNLSLKAEKHMKNVDLAASYTYSKARSVCSTTSSVAQSSWRNNHTHLNPNDDKLSNSGFNVPHTIKASAFYHFSLGKNELFTTTIGLIYEGVSGAPYSLYYNGDMNGDGYKGNDLMYIPTDAQLDQMQFVDYTDANGAVIIPAAAQRENFRAWLKNTPYVRSHRGQYYERYADNLPFEYHIDFHAAEKIKVKVGKQIHALEISLDILNVANMLNKDWGRTWGSSYMSSYFAPISYQGNGKFQYIGTGSTPLTYPSSYYSRWRGQIGVKYTF